MKKLLLCIKDIQIDYTNFGKFYNDMLTLSQKANKNIDQLLVDVNGGVVYCYGSKCIKDLTA